VPHDLARGGFYTGETPQRLAKDAPLLNLSGLSPAATSSVEPVVRADAGQGHESGCHPRDQSGELDVELDDLLRERSVAASHRAERANLVASSGLPGLPPGLKRTAVATNAFVERACAGVP